MQRIDWILVMLPILLVLGFAIYTQRYVKSVADFLSAGRCAGRYLLANARGESDSGLSNTMSKFEMVLVAGFVLNFWEKIQIPVLLLIGITGFVIYRFRETRALTLAQFFEQRYSRRYRLFMGALAFLSGILNYGIFPAISARFFIYFLHLPATLAIGPFAVSTFGLIMATYLSLTVFLILVGGQVTLMVTDCLEGIMSHAVYIVIVIAVFWIVGWHHIIDVTSQTLPGRSMINPFDAGKVDDFNVWYVIMALLLSAYGTMALQNKQGFNSAARTPHESRMGMVLGNWRGYARILMLLALGLCVITYMRHPDFAEQSAPIHAEISEINADRITTPITDRVGTQEWFENKNVPQLQKQMAAPVALRYLLPPGIKGLFLAIMIMGLLAGDSGHMHSWGAIFVQDVIVPLRKTPMSTRAHMWALRGAVTFVAAFAFTFSMLFSQSQYIALWWAITGGVFTGGAGAAIIGGLYWKRGTTAAAWAGTLTGSILALVGIACTSSQLWPYVNDAGAAFGLSMPTKFWLNGQECAFIAAIAAVLVYVVVALITSRGRRFNLDRMLNRVEYARDTAGNLLNAPAAIASLAPLTLRDRFRLRNILRFDKNFTFADKVVSGGIFWWAMFLLAVNIGVTVWNFAIRPLPIKFWSGYWSIFGIGIPFFISFASLIWFAIGGAMDIRKFFAALGTESRDSRDDGTVRKSDVAPEIPAPTLAGPKRVMSGTEISTR
ncbi:sodium/proline symporter PutP [soil metagenome]